MIIVGQYESQIWFYFLTNNLFICHINGKCDTTLIWLFLINLLNFDDLLLPSSFYWIQIYHVSEPTLALSHPWIDVNSVKHGERSIHLNLWYENTFVVSKTFKLRLVNLDKF